MKVKKAIAICLILIGIALALTLIIAQHVHCVDMWTYEGKSLTHETPMDYFFAVSKGAILIALLGGSIPAVIGILLMRKKPALTMDN